MDYEQFDLEVDLKKSVLIKEKVQNDNYAQNLYASMCNTSWQSLNVMSILIDDYWGASWRQAGGIVADLRDKGEDYMDFYCSGISPDVDGIVDLRYTSITEGTITEEIREDLKSIGWREFKG